MIKLKVLMLVVLALTLISQVEAVTIPIRTAPNITIQSWVIFNNITNVTTFNFNVTVITEGNKYEFLNLGSNENRFNEMEILFIRNITLEENQDINFYKTLCADKLANLSTAEVNDKIIQCEAGKQFLAELNRQINENYTLMVMNCVNGTVWQQQVNAKEVERSTCASNLLTEQNKSTNSGWYIALSSIAAGGLVYVWAWKKRNPISKVEKGIGTPVYQDIVSRKEKDIEELRSELRDEVRRMNEPKPKREV